jgi:hypothetical protein
MSRAVLWGIVVGLLETTPAMADLIVTTCGTVVPAGVPAVLNADLDCSAAFEDEAAIVLSNGGKLDLRGHTLTAAEGVNGVNCCALPGACRCSVTSSAAGGRIVGGDSGVFGIGNVTVSNIERVGGVRGFSSNERIAVSDVVIRDVTRSCVRGDRVKAKRVQCYDCGRDGITGYSIRAEDVTVSGCAGAGVDAFLGRVTLKRATITGNGHAPSDGSGSGGVTGTKLVLADVVATGNQAGPLLAPAGTPMDIFSAKKPRLRNTTCEHSGTMGNYDTAWGVCSAD